MLNQKRALIFHGTMGSPDGNWFPWLKDELEKREWNVTVPTFPTPENHSLENWIKALKEQVSNLESIDLLVGHSLGANLILHVLEQSLCAPDKVILVGCTIANSNVAEYNTLNKSFKKEFDWEAIRQNVSKAHILHGSDDPYVPIEQAQTVAKELDINLKVIPNGGHLNAETGYDNFPLLLDLIHD